MKVKLGALPRRGRYPAHLRQVSYRRRGRPRPSSQLLLSSPEGVAGVPGKTAAYDPVPLENPSSQRRLVGSCTN